MQNPDTIIGIISQDLGNKITPSLILGMTVRINKVITASLQEQAVNSEEVIKVLRKELAEVREMLDKERNNLKEFYIPKPINARAENSEDHF